MTKQVREYVGTPVGGREVLYLDTPGIGDIDVPLQKLFALFEQRLAGAEVDTHADTHAHTVNAFGRPPLPHRSRRCRGGRPSAPHPRV